MITKIFITVSFLVLFAIGIFISSVSFDVNYADADGPDEPCYAQDAGKTLTLYLKIRYDEVKREPYCLKTWDPRVVWVGTNDGINESDCKSGKYVDNCYVPAKCGEKAELYLTDPDCKPKLKPIPPSPPPPPPPADEPPPTPYAERDSDGDGIKNSQDHCVNERGPRSNAGCPYSEQPTQQPEPSIPQKEQPKPFVPTPSLSDDTRNMIIYAVVGIIIIAIIAKKLKNRSRRE